MTPTKAAPTEPVLAVTGLEKAFGVTRALDGVSLTLRAGEIHALLGGNGSGKSTFIKALAGVQPADSGSVSMGSTSVSARDLTPIWARDAGLRFVHQNSSTFSDLTVSENLHLGEGLGSRLIGPVRWKALNERSARVLDQFKISATPTSRLGDLGQATQAMIAIARALMNQDSETGHVLVLDEPTAALPANEANQLLRSLTELSSAGHTILYVTHRLQEVLDIADRATVFRDGRVACELEHGEMSHEVLVQEIMGRKPDGVVDRRSTLSNTPVVLDVSRLQGGPIHDATFDVHEGEVVGLAGVVGAGRSSLLRMLFGDLPASSGSIRVGGDNVAPKSPRDAMAAGVALVPEDRALDAVFADMTVTENLGMCSTGQYYRRGLYAHRSEGRDARDLVTRFLVKTSAVEAPVSSLSGGNQQKVVLGRWMRRNPRLLLLDEPTQGVDVAARAEIWTLVREATSAGASALVASSDFEELARVCDRVLILRGGRIANNLVGSTLTEENVTRLAMTDGEPR